MLDKQLNIGDHVVNSRGELFLIERVNKTTYSIAPNTTHIGQKRTIPFSGKTKESPWSDAVTEYFPCEDATAAIVANLRKENDRLKTELQEQKSEVERARTLKENLEWLSCTSLRELEEKVERLDEDWEEE